jgi:phage terminase large subunit
VSDDRFARYREDPCAFVTEVLGVHLYSRQREIVEAVRDHERVACKAGNAVGKSVAAACLILAWLAGGPGSVVVSTSATDAQLRRVLWRETRKRFKQAPGFFDGAVVTETEIRLRDDWLAVGFSTDTPEAMQGIHAERLLVVVDEASGVEEAIFDAIEGLLAGGDARVLLLGNPLRTSGSFYDAFHSKRDEWHCITVDAFSTPNFTGEEVPRALRKNLVSRRWVERLEKRSAGSNTYLVKVLGEFPSQQDDAVISRTDLEAAQAQTVEPGLPLLLGLDVARFGNDQSVLALRQGYRVRVIDSWQGKALTETTGRVLDHVRRLQAEHARRPRVIVDDVGLGGGVTDGLREQGVDVVAFNAGARAKRPADFPNRRSEVWFTAAEVLPLLDLDPRDEQLARELLAPTFSFDSSGARVVEQKSNTRKRLGRSPDRADSVLLTLAVDPPLGPGRARKPRRALFVAKGQIDPGPTADDPLSAHGIQVYDGLDAAHAAGLRLLQPTTAASNPPWLVAGDASDCRGATVIKAPSIAEKMAREGNTVWNGPEDTR